VQVTKNVRCLPVLLAGALWVLTLRLGWAFFTSDLTFEYVASHSRRSAPWWYRVAGMWGGMEGSLLLFVTITATLVAVAIAPRGARQRARRDVSDHVTGTTTTDSVSTGSTGSTEQFIVATVGIGALAAVSLATAWPFARLDVPAVEGFGLTPILEHPAMAIHPPLLYLALACTLPPLLGATPPRRWLLAALALLTAAMTLGGLWSYVEQGWGGYWAWDPVENASLAPWLAAIVALHGGSLRGRRGIALTSLPGVVALAGAASSRSGAVPSVHSFAEAGRVGWGLGAVALVATMFATARVWRAPTNLLSTERRGLPGEPRQENLSTAGARPAGALDNWRLTPVLLVGAALTLIVLLTAVPLIGTIGDRGGRIDGHWFALLLAPVALVIAGALVTLAVRQRSRVPVGGWVAHVGILIMLTGIAGSTFDRSSDGAIEQGATATFAGASVTNNGVEIVDGPYPETTKIVARLDVAGHDVTPSLVAYPDRGGVLAETALITRPWRDIQVVLNRADDEGRALIEVRTKPLVELIWIGALVVVAGALISRRRRAAVSPASSPVTH
jgi:cytochrome c biogenesis factor